MIAVLGLARTRVEYSYVPSVTYRLRTTYGADDPLAWGLAAVGELLQPWPSGGPSIVKMTTMVQRPDDDGRLSSSLIDTPRFSEGGFIHASIQVTLILGDDGDL